MTEKPRAKSSYAKPLTLTPYSKTVIPVPPSLQNRYSALASPSQSYSQTTQKWSPPSPGIILNQIQSFQNSQPVINPYVNKACAMTVTLLEKDEIDENKNPKLFRIFPSANEKIIQYYLPQGYQNPLKMQEYYEFILVDSDSVDITHKPEPNSNKIAYSKCKIKKFITKEEWGNPFKARTFSQNYAPIQYNYFDYQGAWYKAFYLRPTDHSWFFSFCQNFNRKIPSWVHQWWVYFGLTREVLPKPAQDGWDHFHSHIKKIPYGNKSIVFTIEFQIPWIIGWDLTISPSLDPQFPLTLERRFRIKWWKNFQYGERLTISNINQWFITNNSQKQSPKPEEQTPVPQTATSAPQKPLSKKELRKKLLDEISQLGSSDEEDIGSSQPTMAYPQEAQDPFEDYDIM